MRAALREANEWVNGFLMVGNHLALDLLNTIPVLDDGPKELLAEPRALEGWLLATGVLNSRRAESLVRGWRDSPEAVSFLEALRGFRDRLRDAVLLIEAGAPVGEAFVSEINRLLAQYPSRFELQREGSQLVRVASFEPARPRDVWGPIAAAAADLLTQAPSARVRQCESCVVHFLDTSKKGSRRWCSMNICGNKLKVAAYRARNREAESAAK